MDERQKTQQERAREIILAHMERLNELAEKICVYDVELGYDIDEYVKIAKSLVALNFELHRGPIPVAPFLPPIHFPEDTDN